MARASYYLINGITSYRVLAAPVLVWLIFTGEEDWFKWLLGISFFTDLIDGYLARRFHVESVWGSRLDSVGDDLTVLAGFIGMYVFKGVFFHDHLFYFIFLGGMFLVQTAIALIRFGKTTSFHTYLAKLSAILQGCFFILLFLLPTPVYPLFYTAVNFTFFELADEIIITCYLKTWRTNVKGLYWVLRGNVNP